MSKSKKNKVKKIESVATQYKRRKLIGRIVCIVLAVLLLVTFAVFFPLATG